MAKTKPTADEMLKKAQEMLRKANAAKKQEDQEKLIKLGQLTMEHLNGKLSLDNLLAEGKKIIGLGTGTGELIDGPSE